ncbi:transposase [Candidatus Desulfarcum epimagneticum]|uniref:Transposase n=1 Tax=uncultured Desulfobacteraceae bacterium TaxID=218296 RepID=A0A484HHB4_9BACT|nr:transposase [uncultured Desulfobacteraceae bacterium]VEN73802.1 transposase [uncultured Desulfobacteraceae bacterium]VEN74414.1 transposase [uncultured Desulfobacteraceae bacterium]
MFSCRGKPLTPEIKKVTVSVKQYFDRNKIIPAEPSVKRAADALGIGVATVKRIMADYNRDPGLLDKPAKLRGRPIYAVNVSYQESARSYIRTANKKGEHITLADIKNFLEERYPGESFNKATLGRTLNRWGFEFGQGVRSQHLKEKDHVVAARQRYLREMRDNRVPGKSADTIRPEVYLDESYVNKNHSNNFIWYYGEDGPWVQKPTGKGERLIIINAITKAGWVPGSKLVFKSTRKTGDYHGQMNWELFKKWFIEMLLPNIPKKSLIIMDNASYHNILSEHSPPTPKSSKKKIKEWLEKNKVYCRDDCLKAELIEILMKMAPEPIYAIDEIAISFGHKVLRTPPYHPELQPIEICWGLVKNYVARNCDFTMKNLIKQLDCGFNKVTATICDKIIKKIRKIENEFWVTDIKMDAQ